jgi:hypothetical protein
MSVSSNAPALAVEASTCIDVRFDPYLGFNTALTSTDTFFFGRPARCVAVPIMSDGSTSPLIWTTNSGAGLTAGTATYSAVDRFTSWHSVLFSETVLVPSLVNETVGKIRLAVLLAEVDPDCRASVELAKRDAVEFATRLDLRGDPRVMVSDDGVITLQWRTDLLGAALIFAGDRTVSVAWKNPRQNYSDSAHDDVAIDAPLPQEFLSTLKSIIA